MKKVLVYTDSRGQHVPRGSAPFDVFGRRLAKRPDLQVDLFLCPMKWTTTIDFLEHLERSGKSYDWIVLHTGIVDWSPRPQANAIEGLYHNTKVVNLGNIALNTNDYSKKVVNDKKPLFDAIFTEAAMREHLGRDFGVTFEDQPTVNMYSLEMADRHLLPRLKALRNLVFVNSNRFVPGWNGDHARGRPANIALTEQYSQLFRDRLGAASTVDLLTWSYTDIKRLTCDNIHFTKEGSDLVYDEICERIGIPGDPRPSIRAGSAAAAPAAAASPLNGRARTAAAKPLITIVVPVYNVETFLRECLDSLVVQTDDSYEVVIVDDGSTDGSALIVAEYCAKHANFRSHRQENGGLGAARNTGVRLAKGEFVTFVDSDDFIPNDAIARFRSAQQGGDFDIVSAGFTRVTEAGAVINARTSVLDQHKVPAQCEQLTYAERVLGVFLPSIACARLYRTSLLVENGLVFPGRVPHEDLFFTYKALMLCRSHTAIEDSVYFYRQRAGSLSKASTKIHVDMLKAQWQDTKTFLNARRAPALHHALADRRSLILFEGIWNRSQRASDEVRQHCDTVMQDLAPELNAMIGSVKGSILSAAYFPKQTIGLIQGLLEVRKAREAEDARRAEEARAEAARKAEEARKAEAAKPARNGNQQEQRMADDTPEQIVFPHDRINLHNYEKKEYGDNAGPASETLRGFYNKYKGKRCFIIGNGPSLNKNDLSLLKDEYVFAVNSFFYKTEETGFRPTFFVVEDNMVMRENLDRIIAYEAPYKFFPTDYRTLHPEGDNVFFFRMNQGFYMQSSPNYCVPRFSTDASKVVYCGQTVTYVNMQLAYFMGFTEVYLIGMDFNYIIPAEHKRSGNHILSTTDDPNHFHKDYFGKGKTWKDPKLDRVAANYRQAKNSFEAVGRKIYNATVGGQLEIFDRVDYDALLRDGRKIIKPGLETAAGQAAAAEAATQAAVEKALAAAAAKAATIAAAPEVSSPLRAAGPGLTAASTAGVASADERGAPFGIGEALPSEPKSPQPSNGSAATGKANGHAKKPAALLPPLPPRSEFTLDRNVDISARKQAWATNVGPILTDIDAEGQGAPQDQQGRASAGSKPSGGRLASGEASITATETPAAAPRTASEASQPRPTQDAIAAPVSAAAAPGLEPSVLGRVVTPLLAAALLLGGGWLAYLLFENGAAPQWSAWVPAVTAVLAGIGLWSLGRRIDASSRHANDRLGIMLAEAGETWQRGTRTLGSELGEQVRQTRLGIQDAVAAEREARLVAERKLLGTQSQSADAVARVLDQTRRELVAQFEAELRRRTSTMEGTTAGQLQQLRAEASDRDRKTSEAIAKLSSALDMSERARATGQRNLETAIAAARSKIDETLGSRLAAAERNIERLGTDQQGLRRAADEIEVRLGRAFSATTGSVAGLVDRLRAEVTDQERRLAALIETRSSASLLHVNQSTQRHDALLSQVTGLETLLRDAIGTHSQDIAGRLADTDERQQAIVQQLDELRAALTASEAQRDDLDKRLQEAVGAQSQASAARFTAVEKLAADVAAQAETHAAKLTQTDQRQRDIAQRLDGLGAELKTTADQIGDLDKHLQQAIGAQSQASAARFTAVEKLAADVAAQAESHAAKLAEADQRQRDIAQRLDGLGAELKTTADQVGEQDKRLQQAIGAQSQASAARFTAVEKLAGDVAAQAETHAAKLAQADQRQRDIAQRLDGLGAELKKTADQVGEQDKRLQEAIGAQSQASAERISLTEDRQKAMEKHLETVRAEQSNLEQRLAKTLVAKADAVAAQAASSAAKLSEHDKLFAELRTSIAGLRSDVSARAIEVAGLDKRLTAAIAEKAAAALAGIAQGDKRHAEIQALLKTQHTELTGSAGETRKRQDLLLDEVQAIGARIKAVESGSLDVGSRVGELNTQLKAVTAKTTALATAETSLQEGLKKLQATLDAHQTRLAPLQTDLDTVKAELGKTAAASATALAQLRDPVALEGVLNPLPRQPFNRRLTMEHVKVLEGSWLKNLSVPVSRKALGYMAHRICELESRMKGRLATTIEDAMLRCLVAKAAKGAEVNILEIGTLFGIGAAAIYEAAQGPNRRVNLSLLDPLSGYYDSSSVDPATQLPIDKSILKYNLRAAGVDPADVTLIEHLSTAPEALQAASQREYDLLVIDGDHSFAGVATDFLLFAPLVKLGGYVIFDDYNKTSWPDVKRFVDEEMPKHPWCVKVGAEWTTAVFRVAQRPNKRES